MLCWQCTNFEHFRISSAIFAIFSLKRLNLQNLTNMAHGSTYFERLCFKTAPAYIFNCYVTLKYYKITSRFTGLVPLAGELLRYASTLVNSNKASRIGKR